MRKILLMGLLILSLYAENCRVLMNKADNFYTAAQQQTKYKMSEWRVQKLQQKAAYWRGRAIYCQNVKIQKMLKEIKKGK